MKPIRCAILVVAAALAACDKPQTPAAAAPTPVVAPAGTYKLDPNHATLTMKVMHLGLAPYVTRFTRFDATVAFDPKNLPASSVVVTIDPMSIRTDYMGDFQATHKDSPYKTFEEALARDPKYLNADTHKEISFRSTKVEDKGGNRLRITGDLTFLGQTRPVTLDATITGSMAKHPYTGRAVLGFSATTTFKRSEWGMTGTQQYLGDEVTLAFDGEFSEAAPQEPAPAPAA